MTTPATLQHATPPSRRGSALRFFVTACVLVAAVGSAFLWWRTSHTDRNGPNLGVNVPCLLLQATALENGLHCVCMTGYPKKKLSVQFERQTHIHEPGYARAGTNISFAGFRFVLLTHTLNKTDSVLPPFGALVFPYWFLVSIFSGLFLYRFWLPRCGAFKCKNDSANGSSSSLPTKSAQGRYPNVERSGNKRAPIADAPDQTTVC